MHSPSSRARKSPIEAPEADSSTSDQDRVRLGSAADVIRRAYFGEFAAVATRYGVSLGEIFEHCETSFDHDLLDTEALRQAAADRIASHLDDLILAIACIADRPLAWYDLENEYQSLLSRMCELRVGEIDASLHAANFLRTVRDRTRALDPELEDDGTPGLQEYTGLQPLRSFLGGPLFSLLQDLVRDGLVSAVRPGAEPEKNRRRLRLAD